MLKCLRVAAGLSLVSLLLWAAQRAVRDCATGPYSFDNCTWIWLRAHFGLPQSRTLRTLGLEFVGLSLLAGIFVSLRYVLPPFRKASSSDAAPAETAPHPTPPKQSGSS